MTVVYLGLLLVLLAVGAGAAPDSLAGFWELMPHTEMPCPDFTQEEELSPSSPCYVMHATLS